jgi:predicted transcriptional regulator
MLLFATLAIILRVPTLKLLKLHYLITNPGQYNTEVQQSGKIRRSLLRGYITKPVAFRME